MPHRPVHRRSLFDVNQRKTSAEQKYYAVVQKKGPYNVFRKRGARLTEKASRGGCEAHKARAVARAADLSPVIAEVRAAGVTTLRGIADELNRRGIPTAAGRGKWGPVQVTRVLARLPK